MAGVEEVGVEEMGNEKVGVVLKTRPPLDIVEVEVGVACVEEGVEEGVGPVVYRSL